MCLKLLLLFMHLALAYVIWIYFDSFVAKGNENNGGTRGKGLSAAFNERGS